MKKVLFFVCAVLVSLFLAGCGPQEKTSSESSSVPALQGDKNDKQDSPQPKQPADNDSNEPENWIAYTNVEHNYELKHPPNWFYLEDACCPPPPTFVNFNKISPRQEELAKAQVTENETGSIDILCLYEDDLEDIGEVKSYKDEGVKSETIEINEFSGIRFSQQSAPESKINVLTHYLSNPGIESCRITFRDSCQECEKILQTFTFSK